YIAPFSLGLAALLLPLGVVTSPRRLFVIGRTAGAGALLLSLICAVLVWDRGSLVSPVVGVEAMGLVARLDALSVFIFWLVSFLGVLLIQFSYNYLDGDDRQALFLSRLYLTIGAVLFFVVAGNLWQLVLGWVATSLTLHLLLVFYRERPRAIRAARKKFIVARAGDACLIGAAVLIAGAFETTDLGAIGAAASDALEAGSAPAGVGVAAVLVVLAAILKSAMFPFHGWLLEVMETPTPVSALLHAGLLNAGTFLVVRFGELVFISPVALALLILVGGGTALFASSAMVTQSSVKVSLAYSSAAHMGFMLMLCGFGAHSVAIMHLVAHSFYKAHAFLSSGSIVEYVQNTGSQKLNSVPSVPMLLANLATGLLIFIFIGGVVLGIDLTKRPGETALGVIFAIAVTYLLLKGTTGSAPWLVIARTALLAALVTGAFFALELAGAALLGDIVAVFPPPEPVTLAVMVVAVVAFGLVTLLSAVLPAWAKTPGGRALYVHLKNGFYANTLFDRLINRPVRS
ncbi:MAG: proton-conducting transporter membrane subunit, partial [Anaerolineales bacterium]